MKRLRASMFRVGGLFSKKHRERELADEIDSHLQLHIDDNLRAGLSREEARRAALLKLGGVESAKEACRDRATVPFLENLLQDLRFGIRQSRKNPGFTFVAVLVLALGICASTSIFAFVDAALIKPLPYRDPGRLVAVFERVAMIPQSPLSYFDYLDWKRLNSVFTSLEAFSNSGFTVPTPSGAEPAHAARVSAGFFHTLGVTPILGRDFHTGEDLPGAARTVMLSNATWQRRYGAKPDVIGKTVILDGAPYVVIGVLPRDFHFAPAAGAEFWAPLDISGHCEQNRSCHNLGGIARLKDGVSLQAALANITSIAKQLEKQYPGSNRGQGASLLPLSEAITGNIRPILLVLLGAAVLLLLIACANVASLLLVRSESRRREMAVRRALGAAQARLVQQFVVEGFVLVAAGCAFGLLSAYWAIQLLTTLIPSGMLAGLPFLLNLGLNSRVLAFAGAIALVAAMLFSLTPAFHLSLSKMREGLTEGSRGSAGNTWRRLGSKLVVLELAVAVVLLVGAGLLGQSLYRLLRVDVGFQPDRLATLQAIAPKTSYANDQQLTALGRQIVNRISALPGVKSVAISTQIPVTFNGNTDWIRFVGRPYNGEHNEVNERDVSSAYFTTIGAKLLRGRYFSDAEDGSKPRVVIINQALVRKYFHGEDPLGKLIGDDGLSPKSIRQIIGVVDDIREGPLDSEIWPAEYIPFNQSPDVDFWLVVRTSQSGQSLLPALTAGLRQINPNIVTRNETSIVESINDSPSAYLHRSSAWLVGGFAALALLLGIVGLYGVIAYSVSQRTREIGVRMALGAERNAVYRLILKEAGALTAVGILIGIALSAGTAIWMRKLLFGIPAWDPPTLAAVAALLGVSAILASFIPARRAASVSPLDALRAE